MNSLPTPKKPIFLAYSFIAICFLFYLSYTVFQNSNYEDIPIIQSNFDVGLYNDEIVDFLEPKTLVIKNINEDESILKSENIKKLFFIETHMEEVRIFDNPRIACTVESAASINPDVRIYLILLTNSTRVVLKYSELARVILSFDNIHIRFLNIYDFSKGTDLEGLIANNTILRSKFPIEHMADVMRAMVLSKYSGTYLDLDVLSLVPLDKIEYESFACPESINRITNAVIRITDRVKKVFELYLKKLNVSYDPIQYSDNGPKLFSESIKAFCNGTDLKTNEYTKCDEFTILPTGKCYPINYGGYKTFYEKDTLNYVFKRINDSQSYFVHIWSKMNDHQGQHYNLTFNSSVAYIDLAKKLCPHVLKTTEKYF
ncbi:alpha-1,4-N-acetylglucosaminyltransferase-like isoform X1 [Chironomus tepperi]|uniref:alpha-1,4-N-acetylglucosaminyltransferase-like isoform X1 n=1 Tax=Chironomus tepperi TaxID=113505 RepID=UPI00391EF673